MLRSLVGSEMCIRDRVSTQSTGIHSDLKPENVMLDQTRRPPYKVKIADFGLSEVIVDRSQGFHEWHGSPYYMAPELFSRSTQYNEKVDLWAVGIMLHELMHGTPAIKAKSRGELDRKVTGFAGFHITDQKVTPKGASTNASHFVQKDWNQTSHKTEDKKFPLGVRKVIAQLLCHDPKSRPSASSILKDPWFTEKLDSHDDQLEPSKGCSEGFYQHRSHIDWGDVKWKQFSKVIGRLQVIIRSHTLATSPSIMEQQPGAHAESAPRRQKNSAQSRDPPVVSDANRASSACGDCNVM
eukprot:TRINITY_DN1456_c0_g1_i9.p1 TRINITY_DN1456_c0_g1~~TRINITY_DN1456_c0_g1_i9.p1  ORF type:complete len:335 (-),score=77.09 TRINITY_DN1456_c0_g1_i9:296-1183(-)